jgi:hypothetical protein
MKSVEGPSDFRRWPLADAPVGESRGSYWGVKRTSQLDRAAAANDPSATSAAEFAVMHNAALIQQYASL